MILIENKYLTPTPLLEGEGLFVIFSSPFRRGRVR
jgi:hypothetical protein